MNSDALKISHKVFWNRYNQSFLKRICMKLEDTALDPFCNLVWLKYHAIYALYSFVYPSIAHQNSYAHLFHIQYIQNHDQDIDPAASDRIEPLPL